MTKERKIRLERLERFRASVKQYADREKRIKEVFKADEYLRELDLYQLSHKGLFDRIYPSEDRSISNISYERILAHSSSMYNKFTGTATWDYFSSAKTQNYQEESSV